MKNLFKKFFAVAIMLCLSITMFAKTVTVTIKDVNDSPASGLVRVVAVSGYEESKEVNGYAGFEIGDSEVDYVVFLPMPGFELVETIRKGDNITYIVRQEQEETRYFYCWN